MKVKCPRCGIDNLNIDYYCHSCGRDLDSVKLKKCECGYYIQPHFLFCVYCGKEVNGERYNK